MIETERKKALVFMFKSVFKSGPLEFKIIIKRESYLFAVKTTYYYFYKMQL